MADDMGYGDPGCYNPESKIPTPTIDRLAAQGRRFTDAHSPAALCVPTRFGLLTGRFPMRMDRGRNGPLLDEGQVTIGSLLGQNGYAAGCVGKWHLGVDVGDYTGRLGGGPADRGFDSYFGIPASLDIPPYYFIENDRCVDPPTATIDAHYSDDVTRIQGAFWREGGIAPSFRHVDVLPAFRAKAVEFIDRQATDGGDRPFFLYLALSAPHTPWLPTEPYRGRSRAGDYGDFAAQVDEAAAAVLAALERHGLSDDTLVVFTSDNGPVWFEADVARYGHRSVGPLRGMKGDAWEGGHRMPFVVRWPGHVPAGTTCDELICHTDMLATFAAVLGTTLPDDAGADSYDVLPAMLGEDLDRPIREALVHQTSRGVQVIRQGKWKLIPQLGSAGFSEPRSEQPQPGGPTGQLYDLDEDLGETTNVWSEHPEVVKRLAEMLERYRKSDRTAPAG
jgi:arylsulfatase A-like enzyme